MRITAVILAAAMILSSAVMTGSALEEYELPRIGVTTEAETSEQNTSSVEESSLAESLTEPTVSETEVSETQSSETETTVTEPTVTEPSITEPTATEPTATEPTHNEPTTVKPTEPKAVKVKKVTLNKKLIHFRWKGKSKTLKVKISPGNADSKKVKWTTSNKKVAKVSQSGKVTAKGKGHCHITATAKDGSKRSAKCLIVVGAYVKGLKLPKTIVLNTCKSKKLTAKIVNKAAYKAVSWKSSNTKIASVNRSGKVKALNKGKCTVIATAKDGSKKTAKCTVIVKQPVKKLSFETNKITVIRDKAKKLKVKFTPSNVSSKALKWTSSNPKIATVSKNGKVKGRKFGTCTIKATAQDGSEKTAKCKVKVTFDDNTPLTHKELCTKAVMQRVCDKMNKWYGDAGATIDDVLIGDTQYCLYSTLQKQGYDYVSINEFTVSAMKSILYRYSEDRMKNGKTWYNISQYDFDAYADWILNISSKDLLDPVKSGWSKHIKECNGNLMLYCYPVIDKNKYGTEYYIYFYHDGKSSFYPNPNDDELDN